MGGLVTLAWIGHGRGRRSPPPGSAADRSPVAPARSDEAAADGASGYGDTACGARDPGASRELAGTRFAASLALCLSVVSVLTLVLAALAQSAGVAQ